MDSRNQKTVAIVLLGGALAFVVLLVVGAAVAVKLATDRHKASEAVRAQLLELQKRALAKTKDGLPVPDEEIEAMLTTLREQADKAGGTDAGLYRCGAEMIALHAKGGRALQQKLHEMDTLLVAKGADRSEELERRLKILGEFETINQQVITRLEGMPAAAERCLAKNKVPDSLRTGYMRGINQTPNARTAQLAIRKIDTEFVGAARAELTWLRAIPGRYKYEAARDVLVFQRNEDVREFETHTKRIQAISARSDEAGKALVAAIETSIARQSEGK
jgi:hypothetical protein